MSEHPLDPQRLRQTPTVSARQAAERADIPLDYTLRLLRALGLPELSPDAVEFDERDVEVLQAVRLLLDEGYPQDEIINVARTYGYALSRIAHAEVRLFQKIALDPLRADRSNEQAVVEQVQQSVPALLELLGKQLDQVHRRHLAVALQEAINVEVTESGETVTVGFVDLVGFSSLTNDLEADDLGELVNRFETIVLEECVTRPVHVVKMIGDAVMFVAADPTAAVEAAVAIVNAVRADEALPEARAGLAAGEATTVGGDYFGHPVNLAARLTSFAKPGTVVVAAEVNETLGDAWVVSRIGRVRLKGVGQIRAFKVKGAPALT